MEYIGFIYLWFDKKNKRYYIGSHCGNIDDGYVCSSEWMKNAYKNRSEDFKRRILEYVYDKELILIKENYWLSLIKPEELGKRYYNFKIVAAGGNIVSYLSEEKKKEHARKSGLGSRKYWDNISEEEMEKRREHARNLPKDRSYTQTLEYKEMMRKATFGHPVHVYTEEDKENVRKRMIGNKHHLNKLHSDDSKILISLNNPNRKKIHTPFGFYESFASFYKINNISVEHIFRHSLDKIITKSQIRKSKLFN